MSETDQVQAEAKAKVQSQEEALTVNQSQAGQKGITLQFILFSLVGVLNTVVDLVVYWIFIQFSVFYVLANVLSYGAGMLNSYIWNRNVTFRSRTKADDQVRSKKNTATFWRFVVWNGITLLLSSGMIAIFIELAGWSELWSKLFATAIILIVQFTGMKKWVFRE